MQGSNAGAVAGNLVTERNAALSLIEEAKADIKRIDAALAEIVKPANVMKAREKTSGEITLEEDGIKYKIEAEKKVKWDSGILQKLAQKCKTWEQVASLFTIKFEIKEAKYQFLAEQIAAGSFTIFTKAELDAARTVEIGEAIIKSAEFLPK